MCKVSNRCTQNKLTIKYQNSKKANCIILKNHQNKYLLWYSNFTSNCDNFKLWYNKVSWGFDWWKSFMARPYKWFGEKPSFLPTKILMPYNSLVNMKIVYCIEVWGNAYDTNLKKKTIYFRRKFYGLFKKNNNEHSAPLIRKAKVLPNQKLYQMKMALITYKHATLLSNHLKILDDQILSKEGISICQNDSTKLCYSTRTTVF